MDIQVGKKARTERNGSGSGGRLVRSRYLQTVPREDGYVVYHSLFGNVKKVSAGVVALLHEFAGGRDPSEVGGSNVQEVVRDMKKMYYLVEEGTDERDLVRPKLERRAELLRRGYLVSSVQLSISDACNFRCVYCFADRSDRRSEARRRLMNRSEKLMSFETATKAVDTVIDCVKRNGKDRVVVKFFGREPLVNWRVMKRLMDHYGSGEGTGVEVRWDCTTNASLIDEEVAREFARHRVNVYVSVDSVAEANDVNRPTAGGEGSFAVIDRGISLLREKGVTVFASAVLSSLNFDSFDGRMIDYARSQGIDTVITLLAMQDRHLMCQRTRTVDEIADKLFEIYQYGKREGVKVVGYWHNPIRRLLLSTHETATTTPREDHSSCTATGFQVSVEPSGDVFPCRAQSLHLGHIDRFDEMLRSEPYRYQTMRTYMNVPECRGCPIEGFCQGDCLGHLEEMYGDIYTLDESFCEIYRGITRRVLQAG